MKPPEYLIIGNGRVGSHFKHYLSLLDISFSTWNKKNPIQELNNQLKTATHVLILISDDAIEPFILQHLKNTGALLLHFSGSLTTEHAYGAHPLMSFNAGLYTLQHYQTIPFMLDHDAPSMEVLLPGLSNPTYRLNKTQKDKYHALCVLSGNLSCLLWQKLFSSLEQEFNIPPSAAFPYLSQLTHNLLSAPKDALTGPLVRGDNNTIKKNLKALNNDPFQTIYKAFVACYQSLNITSD